MANFTNSQTRATSGTPANNKQKYATVEALLEAATKIERLEKDIKRQDGWLFGGFVVLCFTVGGMLMGVGAMVGDYMENKQNGYKELQLEIKNVRESLAQQCPVLSI